VSGFCEQCSQKLRPYGAPKGEHPGTVARGGASICATCYARRGRAAKKSAATPLPSVEDPIVPIRSWLRPSTYRALARIAEARGLQDVGALLSQLGDHVVKAARR
jgi:hypothetical protein